MFTGIVECTGKLLSINRNAKGALIKVQTPESFDIKHRVVLGDSIANNGVCLTVTAMSDTTFDAFVSKETLDHTCFKMYDIGTTLNLELACTPSTHLGGHIVQGHVDGVGTITSVSNLGDALDIWIKAPDDIAMYIAHKGSIAIDGISLTVNEVKDSSFRLTIIPHTQDVVAIGNYKLGDKVNIEVDVLARYLQRLINYKTQNVQGDKGLTLDTLMQNGFL